MKYGPCAACGEDHWKHSFRKNSEGKWVTISELITPKLCINLIALAKLVKMNSKACRYTEAPRCNAILEALAVGPITERYTFEEPNEDEKQ